MSFQIVTHQYWPLDFSEKHSKLGCLPNPLIVGRPTLERALKEYKEAHRKADTKMSVVAKHSWNTQHVIQWGETTIECGRWEVGKLHVHP